jgi:SAM-dependent methyltransferase
MSQNDAAATKVDTTRLQGMARAYCQTAVLYAAIDVGLFTHVAAGHTTEAALGEAMAMTPLNVERLVTACLAMGLLVWEGIELRNAADVERFLVEGSPRYAGPWMFMTRPQVPGWFEMTERLRDTRAPNVLGRYAEMTVDEARRYHEATYSVGMGAGRRFTQQVDLGGRRKLLDLGGGSGAYSIQAVKKWPQLTAVVFDLPPVVEVTGEFLQRNGVADRVQVAAGDFTSDPLPMGVDAVVMASNLPIYDGEVIAHVVAKAHGALVPGGEMHLVGEMLDDDRTGPLDAALWGLSELINGSAGRAHTIAECVGYFASAGFEAIEVSEFVPGILQRVSGLKASGAD